MSHPRCSEESAAVLVRWRAAWESASVGGLKRLVAVLPPDALEGMVHARNRSLAGARQGSALGSKRPPVHGPDGTGLAPSGRVGSVGTLVRQGVREESSAVAGVGVPFLARARCPARPPLARGVCHALHHLEPAHALGGEAWIQDLTEIRHYNPPTPWGEAAKVGWKEGWDRLIAVLGPHAPWAPPLHAAVLARRPDWVAQVLATGAAVEQRNRARRTPLGAMATLMKNVRHMSGVEGDRKSTTPPA